MNFLLFRYVWIFFSINVTFIIFSWLVFKECPSIHLQMHSWPCLFCLLCFICVCVCVCVCVCLCLCLLHCFSPVQLIVTPWTVAHQAPLSMGFFRQEYWSGLPVPTPEDLPNPGIELASPGFPALEGGFYITSPTWEVIYIATSSIPGS